MNNNTDKDIIKLYNSGNYSTYELAEKFETYPNKIRRILRKNGIPLRSKSAAQKNALKKGRASHPTKGKTIPKFTQNKRLSGKSLG
jgi:intein-encoded DNA endonuclease-like protein